MFKYYVLTSNSVENLARQFFTLRYNDVVVVINTLDKEYEKTAIDYCVKHGIEHHITRSDGTPATGKNSVLDLFLSSENEYMVQVDGDDIITAYGRNLYRTIALSPNAPDVICLYNQLCLNKFKPDLWDSQYDSRSVKIKGWFIPKYLTPAYPHDYETDATFADLIPERLAHMYMDFFGTSPEEAAHWAEVRIRLNRFFREYGERYETFNRMTFLSRKAASVMRYDPEYMIGEDNLQFYRLKKLAYEGELDMRMRNERWAFSYVYMNDTESITKEFKEDGSLKVSYAWMIPVEDGLNKLKDGLPPPEFHLPELTDPYYEVNKN